MSGVSRGGWGLRGPKPRGRGFQPLHPDSANGLSADKRQCPPAAARGTGLRENALTAAQKKTGVGPGRMGPARPQTPRQRFSPLHPDSAKGPATDKRQFPPATTRGTRLRKNALTAAQKNTGDGVTEKCPDGGAKKITGYGFRGRRIRAARRRGSGPPAPKDPRLQCRGKRRTARRLRASGRTESNPHNNPLP